MRAHSDCSIREALFHHGPARVAQPSAEHSASDELRNLGFLAQSDGGHKGCRTLPGWLKG